MNELKKKKELFLYKKANIFCFCFVVAVIGFCFFRRNYTNHYVHIARFLLKLEHRAKIFSPEDIARKLKK